MKYTPFIFATLVAVASAGIPWIGEFKNEQWWLDRHESYVNHTNNNRDSINVLFYGDSITEGWADSNEEVRRVFEEYYGSLGVANYGIGGDRTEHLIWRMKNGEISDQLHPKVCVIKVGTNNIYANDETSIAMGVVYAVRKLRERLPNMKILLLGVLPRTNEEVTRITSNINEIIKHMDNGNTIRYLDMKDHFYLGGNEFVYELFKEDMVHLAPAGYRKWAEVMDPLFRELLNSS